MRIENNLTQSDREALIETFAHGAPVSGKELAILTGLIPMDLVSLKVIASFTQWPDLYYPGENFPKKGNL